MSKSLLKFVTKYLEKLGLIAVPKHKPYLPWPTCFSTVDVAVVDVYKNRILLGKKRASGNWVIFGGFTDPSSMSDAEDAARELYEEAGIVANPKDLKYIGDFPIPDGRYADGPHRIRTHYYVYHVKSDEIKIGPEAPLDREIETTEWFSLSERINGCKDAESTLQPSHKILINALKTYMGV
jgi:8-oxo-dGTP pyrophosphatase MutT (NUDIX family)